MSHQFTCGKSIKDEQPEIIFDRMIKECKKWNWNKVFRPYESKYKNKVLRPKLKPIDTRNEFYTQTPNIYDYENC